MVTHEQPEKTLEDITNDLYPKLSIQQLYRISTMYWDDKYGTNGNKVYLQIIPFSVDDMSKSMQRIDMADIGPPPPI